MITVVYRVVAKGGKEEAFKEIAQLCTQSARKSKGCCYYTFFRSLTNPGEFLVLYKFDSAQAQFEHIENLRKLLGPSPKGRDLPTKFIELLEDEEVVLFRNDEGTEE